MCMSSSAMARLLLLCAASGLLLAAVAAIPPPEEAARMARYVLHSCDWGALATLSAQEGLRGRPFANIFSLSDGPPGPCGGSGVPYLYLTDMEISVQDLEVNSNASLTVSLAQTPYCRKHRYDPQNPLCAHIIFVGSIVKVNDSEADLAKKALFTRHPEMESWPKDHNWFFAKFNITNIWVLDYFGGLKIVTPEEYYSVKPYTGKMKWRRIAILATLQAQLPATDAASVLGLTDPRLCYVLDGFLFIYAVVMTALFVKAKLSQASEPQLRAGQDDVYNKLSRTRRDDYDVLGGKRGADPELGGRHQQRRKNPQDTVYTSLQKDKMGEAYSEIGMKGEQRRRGKGNEGLYQGLSAATKDTYDALQMQPLPPR